MASRSAPSRRASVPTTHIDPLDSMEFKFSHENRPNAEVLLPSLRLSGYTLESAIGDLADNPLDAGADLIVISLEKDGDNWSLSIADNGSGMDIETLDQMMRLGSRAEHDLSTDLGAFGLGSTTASLALGRRQHVVTSPSPGIFFSAVTDLDEIFRAKEFVKHLATAQPSEIDLFQQSFNRWGLDIPETGTLIRVTKSDNINRTLLPPALEAIKKYVGRTYRYFINAGKRFYVNGELVEAIDPLERSHPDTIVLLEESFDYTFPKSHVRFGETESIGAILVQLPNWGGDEANKAHGYTLDRSGFYLLRNRREIVEANTLSLYTRHNALNRFRGEFLFPATLDQDLGVTFLKSAWNVSPSQSLKDKLEQVARPYLRQARRFYNQSMPGSSEQVPHDEAAKIIRQRSPFLRKPATTIEKRQSPSDSRTDLNRDEPSNEHREPRYPKTQRALADIAQFEVKDLGSTAPFFEASLIGRKVTITYNGQHPFYQRFVLENRENRSVISGIDYLVYSMATAEIRAIDEDTFRFIERMREDLSFNLRQLLTT